MKDRTLFLAALVMLTAVALGAFGAHGLRPRITPEALGQWEKGVQYQLVHGLALMALAAIGDRMDARRLRIVRVLFLIGIACFSGSLYLLSTREMLGTQAWTIVLGPITPLGGLSFMAGWLVLAVSALRRN